MGSSRAERSASPTPLAALGGHGGIQMKSTKSKAKHRGSVSADDIAEKALRGEDLSEHFSGKGTMVPGIQRVNVDFTRPMLDELDQTAQELNVSRQAVIKMFVRQSLNQHLLAKKTKDRK